MPTRGKSALALALALIVSVAAAAGSRGGPAGVVGTAAAGWHGVEWLDGKPRPIESLRGNVVLVRWWTDTCPYCQRSAPALVELHERYAESGLVVIGMYHPKPRGRAITSDEIREAARERGFEFPVAADRNWSVLRRWWLDGGSRRATSVSFLIDRGGVIRLVHPGPAFHREVRDGDRGPLEDFLELRDMIEKLLAESA